jgi:hypothetical protein
VDSSRTADGYGGIRTGTIHLDNLVVPGGGNAVLTVSTPGVYPGDVMFLQPLTAIDAAFQSVVVKQDELQITVFKSGGGNFGAVDFMFALLRGRLG